MFLHHLCFGFLNLSLVILISFCWSLITGYSKDALKLVQQYQSVDRFEKSPETEAIVNAKYQ